MEVYLRNLHGQEYKLVPIEADAKTIVAVPDEQKPLQEPPSSKLD
jgi:potassium efflux system protein